MEDVHMTDVTPSTKKKTTIDESLYSRQLYVLGHEAMERMANSHVLLVGVRGLGVEIAKNLILTGVKVVTVHDDEPTTYLDLSAQFYLSEKDLNKPRAAACVEKLSQLNDQHVEVNCHKGELTESFLKQYHVVVMTDQSLDLMMKVSEFCHTNKIAFITADTRGVFANIFCDFGDSFTVSDPNGEQPIGLIVTSISQENPGVVTVVDDVRIPFEDGETVVFTEVKGMTNLNDGVPRKIKLLSPYTFSIEDTTSYPAYKGGGHVTQVKQPQTHKFLPFSQSLQNPEYLISDFAKMDRPPQIHLAFQALLHYRAKHNRLPEPHNDEQAKAVVEIAQSINEKSASKVEKIDEKLIKLIAYGAAGELSAMTAFIGGIAAQEVLKAISFKYTPIKQWFYFDATEMLPEKYEELPQADFQPMNSRYDGNIATLGRPLQEQIHHLRYFLVGAGAIGCEVLKTWGMMGLGTKGMIYVTDMDVIEKSNLSRQFLFRSKDIEQLKSKTAALAVKAMNPDVQISAYSSRVGAETENIFDDKFYNSLSGVCNALDNVEARLYMDSQCVFYKKSLLESGTLGTKGNSQVIVPFLTESYGSSRDPPEKSIPVCTLHHFPNNIDHTIQWARDIFEGLYKNQIESVNSFLSNPNFIEALQKQSGGTKLETVLNIRSCLVQDRPVSFEQCIAWARLRFEEYFNNNIQQLLYNFPEDMITSTGAPFWSPPKRAPKRVVFNISDPMHLDFVIAAANLRAYNYGLKGDRDPAVFKKVLSGITVPEFVPRKGVKINTNENEQNKQEEKHEEDDDETFARLVNELPSPSKLAASDYHQ